jgi:CRISPR-associated protein Cmr4
MNASLLFLHAVTPLHAGIGSGTDVIDLPIAREVSTGVPILPGTSIKGTLRHALGTKTSDAKVLFGPDTSDAAAHAGAVQCTDAYLLCLPVRSLAGVFAWVTSPYLLRRIARDMHACGFATPAIPNVTANGVLTASANSCIRVAASSVVLEDLDLVPAPASADTWIDALDPHLSHIDTAFLREHFCVVSDDVLAFLASTATDIRARVRLTDEKTVATGALWYEESLPCETLLAGLVTFQPLPNKSVGSTPNLTAAEMRTLLQGVTQQVVQFGGKATTGHGYCRVMWSQEAI